MNPVLRIRPIAQTTVLLALLLAPALAVAELEPWDQEKVSAYSAELASAIKGVRAAARNEPTLRDRTSTTGRAAEQYLDTLRKLERSTGQLATRLGAGESREQTLGVARRIGTLLRDAQENGRRLMLTKPSFDEIDRAIAAVEDLSPFYTDEDPLLPNPQQR